MVEVFGQLLLSPFHLVYNRRPLRGSGLPFRGCRSFLGVSVIVYLSRVRAVPYRRGHAVAGLHGSRRARSCWCSASWVRLLRRVKRQAGKPQVSCSGGCKAPRSVSGTPRVRRRTAPSVTRRHSILTGPGLASGAASGAVFRHHDAGASLRAAAVTTCRWR